MLLPSQLELQTLFSGFLFESGLSAVSIKNYLSDLRHFLSFCASITSHDEPPTVKEIFQSISKYIDLYTLEQKKSFTPQSTVNRRLSSIRRFSTFLASKFGLQASTTLVTPTDFPHQEDADSPKASPRFSNTSVIFWKKKKRLILRSKTIFLTLITFLLGVPVLPPLWIRTSRIFLVSPS
jgi:site-specific recombinase XerC